MTTQRTEKPGVSCSTFPIDSREESASIKPLSVWGLWGLWSLLRGRLSLVTGSLHGSLNCSFMAFEKQKRPRKIIK